MIDKESDVKSPIHIVDREYITEWLVIGPFFPNDLETDFLTDAGGEANIHPKEGDTVIRGNAEVETLQVQIRHNQFYRTEPTEVGTR